MKPRLPPRASRLVACALGLLPCAAMAQQPAPTGTPALPSLPADQGPPHIVDQGAASSVRISLEVGQDKLLDLSFSLKTASVPNPEIADIKTFSTNSTQILLSARNVGDTYITLFDKNQSPLQLSVHVTRNLEALRRQLKELFPDENIIVTSAGDLVILSGEVSDLRVPQRMAEVAKLHAPKIANLLHVRGNQQVQIEVKFAEVSRTGLRQMGVNWFYQSAANIAGVMPPGQSYPSFQPNDTQQWYSSPPHVWGSPTNGVFSMLFSGFSQFPFSAVVSLLEQNQLAKTLAEPTLVAMTGQEASFLAGGEIPIPISSALGQISVSFKKFGIQLKFVPTVLSDGMINLALQTEVSDVDPGIGVSFNGITIPGLTSRQSSTTVRLRDGQSFAVAGLLSDKVRSTISKIPLLGEIPILGALFRSNTYRRDETELLVVITARLARPVSAHDAPFMPGADEVNDPDDFELFLLGRSGHRGTTDPVRGQAIPVQVDKDKPGGPTGEVGYMR